MISQPRFILRQLPFANFRFPHWQSALAISFIGALVGTDSSFRATPPGIPAPPLRAVVLMGLVLAWVTFWVGANAMSGAVPEASLGYCIGGIVVGLIPAPLVSGLVMGLGVTAMAMLGLVSPPL